MESTLKTTKYLNKIESPDDLPGVKKKSFKMAFAGGEIWFEHLDGMYDYTELVLQKLASDITTFSRPSYPSCIAFILDETFISDKIKDDIILSITNTSKRFTKIVFVGLDKRKQSEFKKQLRDSKCNFAFSFNNDLEDAKIWLVSEH